MKIIELSGITNLQPVSGTNEWYWSTDYIHGDLYEVEELFRMGKDPHCNSFYLIRYPDGKIFQPFTPKDGRYIGTPVYADGKIFFVLAAFPQGCISIIGFDSQQKECSQIAQLPLNEVEDCYNLLLHTSPLMLSRHSGDIFEIVWPERRRFSVGIREALNFRQGDRLYFTAWYEDPDYREETVVRAVADGTVLETFPGDIRIMPNGDKWLLR